MYLANTVTDNVNWFNQLINSSGWERVIAIGFFALLIALAIGMRMGWITIGTKAEMILKEQLEAANVSIQNMNTNSNAKIEERLSKIEAITPKIDEILPLVRGLSSDVANIEEEVKEMRRGANRNVG